MSYAISNAEGAVVWEGIWWEVTSEGWSEELCLAPGCYSMAIEGDQVSPETVGLELFQSDFVQILELSPADEEGVWDVWFCVEQAQEFNCPEAIGYAEGEGCTWAFEIGSFQEGEEVMWDFGDGSEPFGAVISSNTNLNPPAPTRSMRFSHRSTAQWALSCRPSWR
jgi:hypothetical protein